MQQVKRWWVAVLLGVFLGATLVGVVLARPANSPRAVETVASTRKITIPLGAFHPNDHHAMYYIRPDYIQSAGGTVRFKAPVVFPTHKPVVVEKIILYAYDNNELKDVCVYLDRTNPAKGAYVRIGEVCSKSKSNSKVRTFTDSTISPNLVRRAHGIHLHLSLHEADYLKVYGVRILYHYQ